MNKKILGGIIIIIILLVLFIRTSKPSKTSEIKIGAIYALSGPAAKYGELSARGVKDAVSYFEQKEKTKVQLFLEDSAGDTKQGVSVAQKLFDVDEVKFAVVGTSAITNAVAPIADQYKSLLITDAAGYGLTKDRQYLFQNFLPSLNDVANRINVNEEWKKVAIVYINDDFGDIWGNKILNELVGKTGKGFPFAKDGKDFRTDTLKIKSFSPDVIFILGYGPALNQIHADLNFNGVKADTISYLSCTLPGVLVDKRYSLENTFSYEFPTVKNIEISNWIKDNNGESNTFYSVAFENALIALTAAKKSSQNPEDAISYLTSNSLPMLYGQVSFDAQHVSERDLEITQVINGQCQAIE